MEGNRWLKPQKANIVSIDIMSRQMSIKQAAAYYQVSDRTIHRWIKTRKLKAKRKGKRVYVTVSGQNVSNVNTDDTTTDTMQSEIDHLRQQVDKLTSLLAMQTQQNQTLIAQLPPPRQTIAERVGKLFAKLRANEA